jgi:tRNA(adenine34) deaminase
MMEEEEHQKWMELALDQAQKASDLTEVPVGAVIIKDERVLGVGHNHPIGASDPTAHAEIIAIRAASKSIENYRLVGSTLYVTLEPCAMCAGAIVHARIARLVYGASEPKAGAIQSTQSLLLHPAMNHQVEVISGVLQARCSHQLSTFFKARREERRNLKR